MDPSVGEAVPEQAMGYDARYHTDFAEHWPEARRNNFLYRTDVRNVFSVDTTVWPSLFADLPEPLRALRKAVSQRAERGSVAAVRTIKVTLAWDGAENHHPAGGQLALIVEATGPGGEWQFAGFRRGGRFFVECVSELRLPVGPRQRRSSAERVLRPVGRERVPSLFGRQAGEGSCSCFRLWHTHPEPS